MGGDDERNDWLPEHVGLDPKILDWRNGVPKCWFWKMLGRHRHWIEDGRDWRLSCTQTSALRRAQRNQKAELEQRARVPMDHRRTVH